MVYTLQRLKILLLLLILACQLQAQECAHYGVVSRGFLLGEFNCEVLILSSDGIDIFQPNELPEDFGPGSLIRFSYEILDSTDCSSDVPLINITCIAPFFESTDSSMATCNFDIASTILSDTLGINTYQLEVFNQTDFGAYHPQTVKWYEYETGKALGNEPIITFSPTETSPPVINICADIIVETNNLCETTLCHTIIPETIFPEIEDCQALFFYQPTDQLADNGSIEFYNLSFGNYSEIIWDFGDGQTDTTNALTFTHIYNSPGLYEVCLNIEDTTNGCVSNFCLPIFTVGGEAICNYNDCVFPGDANKDGTVNIFDALQLGIGYNATGEVRPNAVIEPFLQAAFDWDLNTLFNLNFKHIDCNGDGMVDAQDFTAIDQNYQLITQNKTFEANSDLPEITLEFPTDTFYVNLSPSLSEFLVTAKLSLGNTSKSLNDFYGLALSFNYNHPLVKSIETTSLSDSFIRDSTTVFIKDKFLAENQQYGLAITRTDQNNISGEGDIATVSFVIEYDLIEGRTQILEIDLNELIPVDANGEEIPVSIPNDTARVVLVFDENLSVNTAEHLLENQFQIYPNPANDFLIIDLAKTVNLTNNSVSIFNTLGQKVLVKSLLQHQSNLDISNLETGVYWVKIYTEDGVGIQEIVVE